MATPLRRRPLGLDGEESTLVCSRGDQPTGSVTRLLCLSRVGSAVVDRSLERQPTPTTALGRDDERVTAHVDAVQHSTAITTKTNGTGRRRRLEGRRRAFQQASAVAASQRAANQRSSRVFGSAPGAQASAMRRMPKPTSRTLTTSQVKRTMPRVIEGEPNGVLGRLPLVRLGRTQRRPIVAWPRARTRQPSAAIANSTFINLTPSHLSLRLVCSRRWRTTCRCPGVTAAHTACAIEAPVALDQDFSSAPGEPATRSARSRMLHRTQPTRSAPEQADAGVPNHGWRFIHRERPPGWLRVLYIHACTYATL